MANETNEDLDLGDEKKGKKKLIIIGAIVAALLLVGMIGGGAVAYFLLPGGNETSASSGENGEEVQEGEKEEKGPALYHSMDPVFVVNLPGRPSLIQVGVNVRVTSDLMIEFLQHNDPMLRHHLLNLLQAKDAKALQKREAKEALQMEMLSEINRVVTELSGPGDVDALYFTSFVMQ